MSHLPTLITDLALILVVAALTTLLFKRLKQPVVLGYIIAGLLVGSHTTFIPTVRDVENINVLAEVGVIFLLFSLGLEFSFKKLASIGGTVAVNALIEIPCMFLLGYGAGTLFGWSLMDKIFLAGILSISSTTIIIRAFDELGVKSQKFAGIVLGVLIMEDLVAVLLLVLLSTLALTRQFEGVEMLQSVFKLLFSLALWFLAGIFLIPTFLRLAKKFLNDETLLIVSLAFCLGMVLLATRAGFSPALGAFIMGSILAETTSAERIEHLVRPVKDLFAAVFFVSVGILINPQTIINYGWIVLSLTLLIIFGKTINVMIGALISGQPVKQSLQVGMSLAQIGEFSFIIASLGLSLKVTSDFLYPIAVAVSAITTFTTPYLIRLSGPLYDMANRVLPQKWRESLNNYASGAQRIHAESKWKAVVRSYLTIILANGIIVVAIILLSKSLLSPWLQQKMHNSLIAHITLLALTTAAAAPFLWAMVAKKPHSTAYKDLWLDSKYNHGPLLMIEIGRVLLAILLMGLLINSFLSGWVAFVIVTAAMIVLLLVFSHKLQHFYHRIEKRFLHNLNAREQAGPVNSKAELYPWDAHLVRFDINPNSSFAGKSLQQLAWREQYGINIGYIERGNKVIYLPTRDEQLFPYDKIGVIGTDQELDQFRVLIENTADQKESEIRKENIVLERIVVDELTRLKGLSIRSSGLREKTQGLVVGIERNGERIINPASDTIFEWDDIVWLVGDKEKIKKL